MADAGAIGRRRPSSSPLVLYQTFRGRTENRIKRHNLEAMIAWLDALRRRDLRALRAALDPAVVWQGLREDLSCHGPDEVAANFVAAGDEGYDIDALELIPGPGHVVLGAHRAELQEVAGVPLHGEIYNVFAITTNTITRIEDYANRADALTAAGLADD